MLRIVIGIVVVILFLLALFFPRFRRALWATLVIVVTLLAVIIWVDNRERKLGHSRLPPNQIELVNMQVRPGLNSKSYVVRGRVRNHSREFTLQTFLLQLNLKDCDAGECDIVGQAQRRIPLNVPPSQARDFQVSVPFPGSHSVQDNPEWSFVILEVSAQL